jgi:uracil-DNA glycosylase
LRALELTPLPEVRVVVVGQDPYHGPGQAEGLAFSVAPGVRPPPSLRNIFQELQREYGGALASRGSLVHWARQGVLLLNTCLSVEDGCAASHTRQGWEELTAELIWACAKDPSPKVFMLWGAHAQGFADRVAGHGHLLLQANHPSPLSARRPPVPFIGCGHFAEANRWLQAQGRSPVHWLSEEDICAAC